MSTCYASDQTSLTWHSGEALALGRRLHARDCFAQVFHLNVEFLHLRWRQLAPTVKGAAVGATMTLVIRTLLVRVWLMRCRRNHVTGGSHAVRRRCRAGVAWLRARPQWNSRSCTCSGGGGGGGGSGGGGGGGACGGGDAAGTGDDRDGALVDKAVDGDDACLLHHGAEVRAYETGREARKGLRKQAIDRNQPGKPTMTTTTPTTPTTTQT